MPVLIVWLLRGLLWIAPALIASVITRLGLGVITYVGIFQLSQAISSQVFNAFNSIDPIVLQLFGVLQVGTCLNILFSAITVKLTMRGLSGAVSSIKRLTLI